MIRIHLTGRVSIETSDTIVEEDDFGGRQPRLVFAILVSEHRRAVSREELAAAVWPERLPRSWEAALRLVVSKVRVILAAVGLPSAEALTNAFGCYQLHLPPDAVIDLELASSPVTAAEAALGVGHLDEGRDHALAARAITTRPFLPAEASQWAENTRVRLRGLFLRSLEVLADVYCQQGNTAAAVESAEHVVVLDPFRESGHRCLMAAYAKAGNRAAGLKAYEQCRRLLVDELGVGPSGETEAVYLDLLQSHAPERSDRGTATDIQSSQTVLTVPLPEPLRAAGTSCLVGREPELAKVQTAWSLVRDGSCQVLFVAGEAGVGKTTLAANVGRHLSGEGATVFYGRCDKERLIPYQPFVEAVNRYVQQCPLERLRDEVGPEGSDLARLAIDIPRRVPELSLPPPADPETERHRMFGAVAAFLRAVSRTAPTVLVLDDFQWAGPATLVLLSHLTRALELAPLLVIVCYRDDESEPDSSFANTVADIVRERGLHLQLEGLDEKAVAELVRNVSSSFKFDAVCLAGTIRERTAGNPLFVTEILRHVLDTGWSPPTDATSHLLTGTLLDVPRTVHEVIGRGYARISDDARHVLDAAAVIGQQFPLSLIACVTQMKGERLINALDETSRARFTHEVPEVIGCYSFTHALSREVIYARFSGARRVYLHREVAEAIENGSSSALSSAELAHHFELCGQTEKAVRYAIEAGTNAFNCLAYEGAAQHFTKALRLGLNGPNEQYQQCQVLMALAAAHRKAGKVAIARDAYLKATKLARSLGDPVALAGCALGLGGGGRNVSAWIADEVRISLLEEALAALGRHDSELRVTVLAELAKALYFSDQAERRDALAVEAVNVARRLGTPTVIAGALSATRVIRWGPGNTELRLAYGDEVLALTEQSGDRESIIRARLARLVDLIEVGNRECVDREIDSVLELATSLRQPYYLWRATSWEAHRALMDGRISDSERHTADALALWYSDPHPDAFQCSQIQLATLRVMQGRAPEAVDLLRPVADNHPMIPSYRCLLAFFLSQADRRVDARKEFECFATDGFVSPPVDANWLVGIGAMAETCVFLDDRAQAGVLYELLTPFADRMIVLDAFGGGGSFFGSAAHQLGLLAATTGNLTRAERHFRVALDANVSFGARYCASRTENAIRAL